MNVDATFMLAGAAETGLVLWCRNYCPLKTIESAACENGAKPSVCEVGD